MVIIIKVFVEDDKTGIEYKVLVREKTRHILINSSEYSHVTYFELQIYKPTYKVLGLQFYKLVKAFYKEVDNVDNVTELIIEKVNEYLQSIESNRRLLIEAKEKIKEHEEKMRKKYDSIPNKITIK